MGKKRVMMAGFGLLLAVGVAGCDPLAGVELPAKGANQVPSKATPKEIDPELVAKAVDAMTTAVVEALAAERVRLRDELFDSLDQLKGEVVRLKEKNSLASERASAREAARLQEFSELKEKLPAVVSAAERSADEVIAASGRVTAARNAVVAHGKKPDWHPSIVFLTEWEHFESEVLDSVDGAARETDSWDQLFKLDSELEALVQKHDEIADWLRRLTNEATPKQREEAVKKGIELAEAAAEVLAKQREIAAVEQKIVDEATDLTKARNNLLSLQSRMTERQLSQSLQPGFRAHLGVIAGQLGECRKKIAESSEAESELATKIQERRAAAEKARDAEVTRDKKWNEYALARENFQRAAKAVREMEEENQRRRDANPRAALIEIDYKELNRRKLDAETKNKAYNKAVQEGRGAKTAARRATSALRTAHSKFKQAAGRLSRDVTAIRTQIADQLVAAREMVKQEQEPFVAKRQEWEAALAELTAAVSEAEIKFREAVEAQDVAIQARKELEQAIAAVASPIKAEESSGPALDLYDPLLAAAEACRAADASAETCTKLLIELVKAPADYPAVSTAAGTVKGRLEALMAFDQG